MKQKDFRTAPVLATETEPPKARKGCGTQTNRMYRRLKLALRLREVGIHCSIIAALWRKFVKKHYHCSKFKHKVVCIKIPNHKDTETVTKSQETVLKTS